MKITKMTLLLLTIISISLTAQDGNVIEKIVIHGNYNTADAEIRELLTVTEGDRLSQQQTGAIRDQLMESGMFESVEVDLRYTSFDTGGPAALIVRVVEKTTFTDSLMFLPLVGSFEGYGFSYGAQVTAVDYFGLGERVSMPVTWGGTKQIGLELSFEDRLPVADTFTVGFRYLLRDEHQVFDEKDERVRLMSEIGWGLGNSFFLYGSLWYEDITYAESIDTSLTTSAVTLAYDSRKSTLFPYDAVYAAYTISYLMYDQPYEDAFTNEFDLRLYKRLLGQNVVALQLQYKETDTAQPVFDKVFLGGDFWVRGYAEPEDVGDNFYLASLEIRVPLSAVTDTVKWGLTGFYDYAGLWTVDQDLGDALIFEGTGVGAFVQMGAINIIAEIAAPVGDNDGPVQFHGGAVFKF